MNAHATNAAVAQHLREAVSLLQSQGAAQYHVRPYRDAAQAIEGSPQDVRAIFEAGGVKALDAIPKVGLGIASAIAGMLVEGRWLLLDRLRGRSDPVEIPDGASADEPSMAGCEPEIGTLLGIDREYRERAARGELHLIAPKRNNPDSAAWLPIMHVSRGPWHFTAVFSNTARAHALGRTHDWVVVYSYDRDHVERTFTIVTEHHGPLEGRRVVRGREEEQARLLRATRRPSAVSHADAHAL